MWKQQLCVSALNGTNSCHFGILAYWKLFFLHISFVDSLSASLFLLGFFFEILEVGIKIAEV